MDQRPNPVLQTNPRKRTFFLVGFKRLSETLGVSVERQGPWDCRPWSLPMGPLGVRTSKDPSTLRSVPETRVGSVRVTFRCPVLLSEGKDPVDTGLRESGKER